MQQVRESRYVRTATASLRAGQTAQRVSEVFHHLKAIRRMSVPPLGEPASKVLYGLRPLERRK